MGLRPAALIVGAILLVACDSQEPRKPATHDLRVTMEVGDHSTRGKAGDACTHGEIDEAQIIDENFKVIGTARFGHEINEREDGRDPCIYVFTVEDLPDRDFYTIRVTGFAVGGEPVQGGFRGEQEWPAISRKYIAQSDWNIYIRTQ